MFPFRSFAFTYTSPFPIDKLRSRIKAHTGDYYSRPGSQNSWRGNLKNDRFQIRINVFYQNSGRPVVEGKLTDNGNGTTTVSGYYRLHYAVLAVAGLLCLLGIATGILGYNLMMSLFTLIAVPLAMTAFLFLLFLIDFSKTKNRLEALLGIHKDIW